MIIDIDVNLKLRVKFYVFLIAGNIAAENEEISNKTFDWLQHCFPGFHAKLTTADATASFLLICWSIGKLFLPFFAIQHHLCQKKTFGKL